MMVMMMMVQLLLSTLSVPTFGCSSFLCAKKAMSRRKLHWFYYKCLIIFVLDDENEIV